ncbi:hypothetical protein CSC32_6455 [Pseudomonas aeruginosa]|nr:hypothetical protein CSC32_6455 [Pseudomonas aeruginosa]
MFLHIPKMFLTNLLIRDAKDKKRSASVWPQLRGKEMPR